jgi:hypothetical protein
MPRAVVRAVFTPLALPGADLETRSRAEKEGHVNILREFILLLLLELPLSLTLARA